MHPTFVRYFREHGATPILQKNLLERRGFTHDMIIWMVRNCNKARGLKKPIPSEYLYMDELDTDEELGALPRTSEVGRKRPRGQEKEDLNDEEWDPDVSTDTIFKGRKPFKKACEDLCPMEQPYYGLKKGKGKKGTETGIMSKTVEDQTMFFSSPVASSGGKKLQAQWKHTQIKGVVARKEPRKQPAPR